MDQKGGGTWRGGGVGKGGGGGTLIPLVGLTLNPIMYQLRL